MGYALTISRCRDLRISRSLLAGAAFWYLIADKNKAELFFGKLASGAGLDSYDPILHLRNQLIAISNILLRIDLSALQFPIRLKHRVIYALPRCLLLQMLIS